VQKRNWLGPTGGGRAREVCDEGPRKLCSVSFPQWQGHPACALLRLDESPVKTWDAGKSGSDRCRIGFRSCHAIDWTPVTLTITLPTTIPVKRVGLELWMNRVSEMADKVQDDWDADNVHDLRVALRRCRAMADAVSEVNPRPGLEEAQEGDARFIPGSGRT
jgi:hypothetical protein